jgi:hypothetical protein
MSSKGSAKLPEMPKEFPHIFTEVVFQLIPEVDYDDLVYLSQLLKINKRVEIYRPLADALRKIQWTKLASMEAIAIEKEVVEQAGEGILVSWPIGQVRHAKAVFEFITHTKSALDSMAVFLTEFLSIPATGGKRDLKHEVFRDQVIQRDAAIGAHINSLGQWFVDVQDRRDKWIHRTSTRIFMASGPSEIGLLPIPKVVAEDSKLQEVPPTKEHYWSTPEFIEFHFTKLTSFFGAIVTRCIEAELANLEKPLPPRPKVGPPISVFPVRAIKDAKIKEIRERL